MNDNLIKRFWEVTCTLTPLLYFVLVMVFCLLLLSLLSFALLSQNRATNVINMANVVISTVLLGFVLLMIRKCRDVYN